MQQAVGVEEAQQERWSKILDERREAAPQDRQKFKTQWLGGYQFLGFRAWAKSSYFIHIWLGSAGLSRLLNRDGGYKWRSCDLRVRSPWDEGH